MANCKCDRNIRDTSKIFCKKEKLTLPNQITAPGGAITTMTYDNFGRQLTLNDPNAGLMTYTYDIIGQLLTQADARGNIYNMTYDALGRMLTKTRGEEIITYFYDTKPNGKGMLSTVTGFNGINSDYSYDSQSRLQTITEQNIDGKDYSSRYEYDNLNRVTKETYPGGFAVNKTYNSNGYLEKILKASDNGLIWQCDAMNQRLQVTNALHGNGGTINKTYNNLGFLQNITAMKNAQTVMNYDYNFEPATGNLSTRSDKIRGLTESFTYDNLDRLKNISLNNNPALNTTYYSSGNIADKSDVGVYNYDGKPHAVSSIDNPSANIPVLQQNITYTAFQKAENISENNLHLHFTYGPDYARKISLLTDNQNNTLRKIIYAGNYEKIMSGNNTYEVKYIAGGDGLCAIAVKQNAGREWIYYAHTDHLGSIVGIYDNGGQKIYAQSFDAWGRERNPDNWTYTANPSTKPQWLIRGFTGHEHHKEFGLINMNGRLYDPLVARMLSPDNFVQNADFTQTFNRYSYAGNNPLKYTDPDGENPLLIATAVYFVFFTETGYDLQKYVSPVAVKVDVSLGTHQRGVGIQGSVGVPQILPVSARVHGGVGYYWKNYDVTPGWQTTYGYEIGLTPFFVTGSTTYNGPGDKFDQRLWDTRIGIPGLNVKYENDMSFGLPFGDGGDRYRTAALKIQVGPVHVGMNLFTGDPGLKNDDRITQSRNGKKYYIKNPNTGADPDEYRAGVGYIGIGPFRFGTDTENRRHNIQNVLIHDKIGSPRFSIVDRPNKFYFQFGSGGGFLW
ncbi:MAG: polymorphic toxin type 23 domain-containing protein [Bacteroidota bacterium]